MTDPTDDEIREAVEKLKEAAKKKALDEATDSWIDGNGQGHHETPSDETKERIDEELAALEKHFEDKLSPKPDDFDFLIDTTKKVEGSLGVFAAAKDLGKNSDRIGGNADFGLVDTAKGEIQKDWDGKLRNQLIDNYLTPLYPNIIATQGGVARFLRQHAELMKRIYQRRRSDAKKIAEQGVTAIEAITDSKGSDLKILLSVVGGLIGLGAAMAGPFAAPIAGPLAIGLSSAAWSAGSAIGGNFIPADKDPVPLGADTVEGVVDNIYKALADSDKTMQDEEDELLEALQAVEGVMYPMTMGSDLDKGNDLSPMRPDIADTSDVEDLKDGMTVYGDGGDDGSDGRGSYKGPDPPEDFDGSVDDTSGGG